MSPSVLEIIDLSKDYRGLRPLRIERLDVAAGEQVAIVGLDSPSAEVLVNLVTGATLPDRGRVRLFGRDTSAIADSADWLATVDRIGIVTERAVLLDGLSVTQNLAVPFTLEIDPPPDDVRQRAIALALEVGLSDRTWERPIAELDEEQRVRVRLARALALAPGVLLVEHASARLSRPRAAPFGRDLRRIAEARNLALLAATADPSFAGAAAGRVLTHEAASGRLSESRKGWFRRR